MECYRTDNVQYKRVCNFVCKSLNMASNPDPLKYDEYSIESSNDDLHKLVTEELGPSSYNLVSEPDDALNPTDCVFGCCFSSSFLFSPHSTITY